MPCPMKRVGKTVYRKKGNRWVVQAKAKSERSAAIMLSKLNQWAERKERGARRRKK